MCVCVSVSIWYVRICVCIDLRLGWEPCSVPAWLINGVVMAIGRNEGTERRRPASLDPYAPPGTHTPPHSHTHTHTELSMPYTFLTDMLVTHTILSACLSCIVVPLLLFSLHLSLRYFCPLFSSSALFNFFLLVFTFFLFLPSSSFFQLFFKENYIFSPLWKCHCAAFSMPLDLRF